MLIPLIWHPWDRGLSGYTLSILLTAYSSFKSILIILFRILLRVVITSLTLVIFRKLKLIFPKTPNLHIFFEGPLFLEMNFSILILKLPNFLSLNLSHHVDHHTVLLVDHSLHFFSHPSLILSLSLGL